MTQSVAVDPVADAQGQMPFNGNSDLRQGVARLKQRLRRDKVIALAVHKQHRGARPDVCLD